MLRIVTRRQAKAVSEPSAGMMVSTNVRLLRPLGEGGMGAVWVAEHQSLRTQVVVKFMAADLVDSPEATARFAREAAAASQVKSPHVVQTFDHGITPEGTPYIVMELLEGRDLEHHIRAARQLPPREVVAIVAQLSRALSKAHERGIVHRDIKPSNVFLCDAGGGELFVKLLDFGIAKGPDVAIVGSTTRTGTFVGSPYYMSPEQVVGAKDIDFRTDLWSLGVVAFEALTGQRPFYAETVGALALKIHRDPLPKLTEASPLAPGLPPALDAWFERACAREPGARFGSAREMAEALAVAATGQAMPAAVSLERTPASLMRTALAATEQAPAPDVQAASGDVRSETGSGVGLSAPTEPGRRRGRLLLVGAIGVAALGVGLAAPRLLAHPEPPPAIAAGGGASMPTPTPAVASAPVAAAVVLPPLPTATVAPEPATTAALGSALPHPASAGSPGVLGAATGGRAHPHASASAPASATPAAPGTSANATPVVVKPPPGSDDDIK